MKVIDSKWFKKGIALVKKAPTFKPCNRVTLSRSHLDARDAESTLYVHELLESAKEFGLWITGDGYKSKPTKRQYHNFVIGCCLGVLLALNFAYVLMMILLDLGFF